MKNTTKSIYEELFVRYPVLQCVENDVLLSFDILLETLKNGKKIFLCGNGGSAADCEHITGELMKSFKKKRPLKETVGKELQKYGADGEKLQAFLEGAIPVISLTSHIAFSTAFANDKVPTGVFAQQLYALGEEGDALLAISTSGNSENCVLAATLAKAIGVSVVALTGKNESRLSRIADATVKVPEIETYKVQELHLPIYHCLCAMLEEEIF